MACPPASTPQLAEEVWIHVMRFLPIQAVFLLMSVCRNWEAAARAVVRTQERLLIASRRDQTESESPLDCIVATKDIVAVIDSVSHMSNLKVLKYNSNLQTSALNKVIGKNASSLQVLDIFQFPLPLKSGDLLLTYPNLVSLRCQEITPGVLAAAPNLTTLKIRHQKSIDNLSPLDAGKITTFSALVTDWSNDKNLDKLVNVLHRLTHLTSLRLALCGMVHDVNNIPSFLALFDFFTRLEEVRFRLERFPYPLDAAVAVLVKNNPCLRTVSMIGLKLQEASFSHFASLHNLSSLEVISNACQIQTSSINEVMLGCSRFRPRKLSFQPVHLDYDTGMEIEGFKRIATQIAEAGGNFLNARIQGDKIEIGIAGDATQ